MNEKQKRFVQEYVVNGFNARQAALSAGYTEKTANIESHRMVNNANLKPAIERGMAMSNHILEQEIGLTVRRKAVWLVQLIEDVLNPDNPKRDYYKDAIKAIDQLNKMQGHHMPTRSLSVTVDATKEKLIEATKIYSEF